MKRSLSILFSFSLTLAALLGLYLTARPALPVARANNTYQALPFSQNWTNTALIAADDDWSGVPGVIGYRGDNLTGSTGTDPQTILVDGSATPVDVIANQSSPITITGGVGEFEIADPVVALQGSGTADAPFLLLHLNTSGLQNITISYNVRDIDGSADNAAQQVALHYRVGTSGNFTNLPGGYIADATEPNLATKVTSVTVTLPTAADNQPQVQLRIMTTNAVGSDEWVGIDDISVTGTPMSGANLGVVKTGPAAAQAGDAITYTINLFNTGTVTATSSVLTDTLPPEVNFITYTSALAVNFSHPDAQTLVWDLGDVANGASGFITVQGVISSGLSTGTWLTNTVTASTTATETTFANNTSQFFTLIGELPPFTPIATARAAGPGWTGGVEGNVTVPPGIFDSRTFAIQDATGGVYVYKVSGIPALALGDLVQVTGTLKSYNGLLEFDPTTAIVRVGSGSVPAPQVISTSAAIVTNTQGLLVRVTGLVTWTTTPPAPGASDWSFYVNDGSGAIEIFVDKETQLDMRGYTSATQGTITGFSASYYYQPQIMPRYQSDVDIPDVTPPTVTATVPLHNASDVSLYQPLSATFSENLNPATVTTDTFTLADVNGSISGTVSYVSGTRTASFTPDSPLTPLTVHTATLTTGIQDQAGNPLAAPYLWGFTTGATDTTPPTIVDHFPAADVISVPLSSNIVITFSEDLKPSTVIPANFTLVGPSGSIGWSVFAYDATTDRLVLTPIALVAQALHTITISSGVTDWAGHPLSGTVSWLFATEAVPEMHAFHGDLHNHTGYSDGSQTPDQAYAIGRANGFDFMAVTDHSYAVDDSEWADMLIAANNATIPGAFVALRGVEYTQGAEGHINVINSVRHAVRSDTGCLYCDYTPNLEMGQTVNGFYNWLTYTGTQALDSGGTIAQFNHPGWINFNDWTYHPEVSPTLKLEEVGNGSGVSYAFSEDEYIRSLDYGWKVGATNNADTHSTYWGSNTPHRTGVWMPSLTKADLMAALHARRTFASEDKNYELGLKGNDVWMGSEIPNTGAITFEITGFDPDGEGATLVQLISFGGEVVTQTTMSSSNFTWNPIVPVTPGVHYFYAKVTQPDSDRIVSSPLWTRANVNLSITDLAVEPTIATIYNPSLITARISNRMDTTQTVTVTFQINGTPQAVLTTTVPRCITGPCADAYPAITWQPPFTGPVTITAILTGVPAGDNPDDNTRTTTMNATAEKVPLVLIDAGHGNIASSPRDVRTFVNDLTAHGYNVLLNLDQITASDLNTETVKLLIINAYGPNQLTVTETQAIGNFVNAGGSLWLNGIADYAGKIAWAGNSSTILNGLVTAIENTTSSNIPIRLNSDEVLDGNDNNGYPWGVLWHIFPSAFTTGIGMNVENIQSWSLCSLTDRNGQALTQGDLGANGFIVALGDEDTGTGTYGEPNRTHNENSDPTVPAFLYTAGNSVPAAAAYDIPGSAGRLFFYGDANDPFNIFAYTAGDGKQNELFNLQTVMWLLGEPITKTTIAQARAYNVVNQPDKLDQLVWVEGKITAAFGEFFNVLYVQDETGGITVHAPAGDIDATQYARGVTVRVLGTIGIYDGDTEVEFFEVEQVQILTTTSTIPAPLPFSTHDTALEQNQGWLTQITGTVTSKGADYIMVNDSSGPVRAFLDGYNGTWDDVLVSNRVTVKGLISEDGNGPRIRVRNHGMHPSIPDDVAILADGPDFSGSTATVTPTEVTGGELLTYTLIVANSGNLTGSFSLTDTLDTHVSLVSAPNMTATGSTLTATGTVASLTTQTFVITVRANDDYTGTLSNTAQLSGDGSTRTLIAPNVTVSLPLAADFSGSSKLVNATITTGSQPFTYTLIISNSGTASGTFVLTDTLDTHLTLISAPGFTVDGATLTVSGTLNAPALQSFTIVVRATAPFSGTIDNTAQLSGDGQTRALIAPTVTHKPVYFTYLPLVQK